jgi:Tfp pilus assembly protein PilE
MIEIVTILALIGLIGFQEYHNRKERAKLINAILAKNNQEFKEMELADKTKIEIKPPKEANLIPENQLTDDQWFETEIKGKKVR